MPSTVDGSESAVRELVDAARRGSSQAIGELLEGFRPYLLLIANAEMDSDLRAKAGASDLVQESFLEAQRDIGSFRGTSRDELLAWLRQTLLNNVADLGRRYRDSAARRIAQEQHLDGIHGPALRLQLVATDPSPSTEAMANEQVLALNQALARLPDDHRRALVLRHQEQRSFAEIGQALNRSAEAARKLWFRAVERLREDLVPKG